MESDFRGSFQFFQPVIIIAIVVFIVIRLRAVSLNVKKQFKSLKNFLNGRVESRFFSLKFKGDYKGMLFEIRQIAGGKNSPPKIRIKMRTHRPLSVKINKHSLIFSLGEKLGILSKSVSTGDEEFDNMFRVSSSSGMNTVSFLSSAENRKIIQSIFNEGFNTFNLKAGHIEIMKPYQNIEDELRQDKIISVLERLHKLALA